jgi:hypothetical protein
VIARAWYTLRKTLWYWLVIGDWTWPQTHWRKYGARERWLRANRALAYISQFELAAPQKPSGEPSAGAGSRETMM